MLHFVRSHCVVGQQMHLVGRLSRLPLIVQLLEAIGSRAALPFVYLINWVWSVWLSVSIQALMSVCPSRFFSSCAGLFKPSSIAICIRHFSDNHFLTNSFTEIRTRSGQNRTLNLRGNEIGQLLPSVGVKDGLSCVIIRAIGARKTPNLALPSLQSR